MEAVVVDAGSKLLKAGFAVPDQAPSMVTAFPYECWSFCSEWNPRLWIIGLFCLCLAKKKISFENLGKFSVDDPFIVIVEILGFFTAN